MAIANDWPLPSQHLFTTPFIRGKKTHTPFRPLIPKHPKSSTTHPLRGWLLQKKMGGCQLKGEVIVCVHPFLFTPCYPPISSTGIALVRLLQVEIVFPFHLCENSLTWGGVVGNFVWKPYFDCWKGHRWLGKVDILFSFDFLGGVDQWMQF